MPFEFKMSSLDVGLRPTTTSNMKQGFDLKKVVPDISWPKKSLHYLDALDEREIDR
jgi:hypothetical protein